MKRIDSFSEFVSKHLLTEKMALVDYSDYVRMVAEAYKELPVFDESVVYRWQILNESNYKLFRRLLSRTEIIFVSEDKKNEGMVLNIDGRTFTVEHMSGDPYPSQEEMKRDWEETGKIYISIDYSDHPVFSLVDNIVFRSVHDFIVHIEANHPFGGKGEIASYNTHSKLVPKDALPALFTEVVAQACYAVTFGNFPVQKIAVLKGFDFYNLGKIEGYDIERKRLVKKDVTAPVMSESSTGLNESWYHGTPDAREVEKEGGFTKRTKNVEYVKDINKWKDLQTRLRDAFIFDKNLYHSLLDEVRQLMNRYEYKSPLFLTDKHSVAKTYADPKRAFDYQNAIEKVYEVEVDCEKVVTINAHGSVFRCIPTQYVKKGFMSAGVSEQEIDKLIQMFNYYITDNVGVKTDVIAAIGNWLNFDCIDVINVLDSYEGGKVKSTVRMVLDPTIVRLKGRGIIGD